MTQVLKMEPVSAPGQNATAAGTLTMNQTLDGHSVRIPSLSLSLSHTHTPSLSVSAAWLLDAGATNHVSPRLVTTSHNLSTSLASPAYVVFLFPLLPSQGSVQVVTWNEQYQKLTTSDALGLIIVWIFYKGHWYEEMINNRNRSYVRGMKWNADGQKICIVYEDGMVIVGGVDGDRQWGKELGHRLCQVEWNPDGKRILFGTVEGEVLVYDQLGNQIEAMELPCLEGAGGDGLIQIVGIDWYSGQFGYLEEDCPSLVVCFGNGRLQIMRDERDQDPCLIDTEMQVAQCAWNQRGTVLALAGVQTVEEKEVNVVQFYTPFGDHLRTLKVPGSSIKSLTWEGGGLRIALAVDYFVYFANVRPDYKWGYFSKTVVYAFTKPERSEHCVVFWDTKLHGHQVKYVRNLIGIAAAGDHCVLSTKTDDGSDQYVLILCNAMGTPVDSKYIDIQPTLLKMTKTHVVAASENCVYVWAYKSSKSAEAGVKTRDEKIFHIDDSPSGASGMDPAKFKGVSRETPDTICCMAMTETTLVVGRESGILQSYTLPRVALESKFTLECRPDSIALNCNATRVSIIDISGLMTLFDFTVETKHPETGEISMGAHIPGFERKDVWDMMWAEDNPELFAIMERTYMYIFRGVDPEEPSKGCGWLCEFNDLEVKSVLLDDVLQDAEHPTKELFTTWEIKSLRDTQDLLDKVGIDDATVFVEDNPHPRLWRLLAESALGKLELEIADRAFVRCEDYPGIDFVKKLKKLDDRFKQQAEVAVYFQRFEEAERMYIEDLDRMDLAQQLRIKLGDWFRVVQLLKTWSHGDDKLMEKAWNKIGDYFADRLKWDFAAKYYVAGRNPEKLAECYYRMEDYTKLEMVAHSLKSDHPLLPSIAEKFTAVGMCGATVEAFKKCNRIKDAVDVCVFLNQWDMAKALADQHDYKGVDSLFTKYASHLMEKGKITTAIDAYREAGQYLDAAKLLYGLAQDAAKTKLNPLRAKKLYVLAALQVESYRDAKKAKNADPTRSAIDGMLAEDSTSQAQTRMIDTAWRGAEAFHFFLLAQRQLASRDYAASLKTANVLVEYDDILDPVQAYTVQALAALANKSYADCSKAFIKLESLKSLTETQRKQYEELSLQIFRKHRPVGESGTESIEWSSTFTKCSVVTGRPVLELEYWICLRCAHRAGVQEIGSFMTCPLCHTPL
jgi:WD repeat-containing protein 35